MTPVTPTIESSLERTGSVTAVAGALTMLVGAALYFTSGAVDLWAALADGEMSAYLAGAEAARGQLVANHTLWILGVLLLGVAIRAMSSIGRVRPGPAAVAVTLTTAAVPIAIVSFIMMMSLTVQLAPDTSGSAVTVAEVAGWIGARADDLATALLVGAGPLFVALAARGDWLPRWLAVWAYLAATFGAISLAGLFVPALADVGFLVVPIGLIWMIAAGITLARPRA